MIREKADLVDNPPDESHFSQIRFFLEYSMDEMTPELLVQYREEIRTDIVELRKGPKVPELIKKITARFGRV